MRATLVAGLISMVGGCSAPDAHVAAEANVVASLRSALEPATFVEVCSGTHWVGRVSPEHGCPTPGAAWTVSSLFGDETHARLAGYCLYQTTGPVTAAKLAALPSYLGTPGKTWLDRDCAAVSPMGTVAARSAVFATLSEAYFSQLEMPASMSSGSSPVRVAVVDSWPSASNLPGQLRHGVTMGALIHEVACGATTNGCNVSVAHHLALNLEGPDDPNEMQGGYASYLHHLAVTIVESVRAWQIEAPSHRLVVNLSLGWDERYGEDANGVLSVPAEAVRSAIEFARLEGALVIAAAGNETAGPSPSYGPTLPGGWQTLASPLRGPARPLVYAAGGVDFADRPLRNGRPDGRPPLAAPGFFAMVAPPGGGATLGPTTGTSVATAAISGIAAAVWSQHGALSPDEVMAVLRAQGEDLAVPADFCLAASCSNIRRVSLCRALTAVGAATTGCTTIPAYGGSAPDLSATDVSGVATEVTRFFDGTALDTPHAPAVCSTSIFVPALGSDADDQMLCATEHLYSSRLSPLVEPQPDPDPCGMCFLLLEPEAPYIYIGVNERILTTMYPQTLSFHQRGVDRPVHVVDLGSAEAMGIDLRAGLLPGEVVEVALADDGVVYDSATLEWLSDPSSPRTVTISEVLLDAASP